MTWPIAFMMIGGGLIGFAVVQLVWRARIASLKGQIKLVRVTGHRYSIANHASLVTVELATLPASPWPSGRTWTDDCEIVHSIPAGFFAITLCGQTLPCVHPNERDPIDRYPYDRANQANCVASLAKEGTR